MAEENIIPPGEQPVKIRWLNATGNNIETCLPISIFIDFDSTKSQPSKTYTTTSSSINCKDKQNNCSICD